MAFLSGFSEQCPRGASPSARASAAESRSVVRTGGVCFLLCWVCVQESLRRAFALRVALGAPAGLFSTASPHLQPRRRGLALFRGDRLPQTPAGQCLAPHLAQMLHFVLSRGPRAPFELRQSPQPLVSPPPPRPLPTSR